MKDSEKRAAREKLRELLDNHPMGTIRILWVDGMPTNTGRSDYFSVELWDMGEDGRPESYWLSGMVCTALGYRFNRRREAVTLTGCGYSKRYQIAQDLVSLTQHDLTFDAPMVPRRLECPDWAKGSA